MLKKLAEINTGPWRETVYQQNCLNHGFGTNEMIRKELNKQLGKVAIITGCVLAPSLLSAQALEPEITEIVIMPLGDSITQGVETLINGAGNTQLSYRKPLEDDLIADGCAYITVGDRTETKPVSPSFANRPHQGKSGWRAEDVLNGYPDTTPTSPTRITAEMIEHDPSIILMHLGTNDSNRGRTASQAVEDIEDIVTNILAHNSNAQIFVANLIPWFTQASPQSPWEAGPPIGGTIVENVDAVTAAIDDSFDNPSNSDAENNDLGSHSSNVYKVDVRSGFDRVLHMAEEDSQQDPNNPNDERLDAFHPNGAGDMHIADAFLSAMTIANVCQTPSTNILIPSATLTDLPSTVTFRGTAISNSPAGIRHVKVALLDRSLPSGSGWIDPVTGIPGAQPTLPNSTDPADYVATLSNVTSNTADWSITFNNVQLSGNAMGNGQTRYRFFVAAVDHLGNSDQPVGGNWTTRFNFDVVADPTGPDVTAPIVHTTRPPDGVTIGPNGSFELGGLIDESGSGAAAVRVRIRRTDDNSVTYWDGSGWVPNSVYLNATLINADSEWILPGVDLSTNGDYRVWVTGTDIDGNFSSAGSNPRVDFSVESNADTTPPEVQTTTPSDGAMVAATNSFDVGGTVVETGSGTAGVRVRIRRSDSPAVYWDGNNWTPTSIYLDATLLNNGSEWTLPGVDLNTAGNYRVWVKGTDRDGNVSSAASNIINFSVQQDSTPPVVTTTTPGDGTTVSPSVSFDIGGTVVETESPMARVRVRIRRADPTVVYWDGINWTPNSVYLDATLINNDTEWTLLGVDLSIGGSYRVWVKGTDAAGNTSTASSNGIIDFSVQQDTTAPVVDTTTPADESTIMASSSFDVGGTVDETGSGTASVRVRIRRAESPFVYWDGLAWTPTSTYLDATVTNAGSEWILTGVDLSTAGDYRVWVTGTDNDGNFSSAGTNERIDFTVETFNDPPPLDLSQVQWLHTDVSLWAETETLVSVTFQTSGNGTEQICLDYTNEGTWPRPSKTIGGTDLVGNPWVFIWNEVNSLWYGGTWEWLRPNQECKAKSSVAGDHIKQAPYDDASGWTPTTGEVLYFMVSGLARNNVRNELERTQPVKVIWP